MGGSGVVCYSRRRRTALTPAQDLFLFAAAALGGSLNSVVGGGSFVAFPALVFAGVPAVTANATTAMALWPGTLASTAAYRRELRHPPLALLLSLSAASLVGGGLGALLLLRTSDTTFVRLIPWLLLLATLLFSFSGPLTRRLRGQTPLPERPERPERPEGGGGGGGGAAVPMVTLAWGVPLQLLISIYGGYFGGGMGIMMMAGLSLMGLTHIHLMNGLRTLLSTLINGVALLAFAHAHALAWRPGLVMVVGASAAGYLGAALARRLDPRWVRRFVMAVAWGMTAYFFIHAYTPR